MNIVIENDNMETNVFICTTDTTKKEVSELFFTIIKKDENTSSMVSTPSAYPIFSALFTPEFLERVKKRIYEHMIYVAHPSSFMYVMGVPVDAFRVTSAAPK